MIKRKHQRLAVSIVALFTITIISGLLIPHIENSYSHQSNINDAQTGIWWAVTTATGVGYGDVFPITLPGRIIGMIVQIVGVTIYGMIVSLITLKIVKKEDQYYWSRTTKRFDRIEEKIDKISSLQSLEFKEKSSK